MIQIVVLNNRNYIITYKDFDKYNFEARNFIEHHLMQKNTHVIEIRKDKLK